MVPYILSNAKVLTVFIGGRSYQADSSHPNYSQILERIKSGDTDNIESLFDIPTAVSKKMSGKVTIEGDSVYYNGTEVFGSVVDKIIEFVREGYPTDNLIRFLERLMNNPSKQSIQHLYCFLDKHGLTIAEDGRFIAYKSVRPDYKDWHTNTVDNSVGATPRMERNQVDDDRSVGCSTGYHAGSLEYARDFHSGDNILLAVLICPSEVVSVPSDCQDSKIRCCSYEVMSVMEQRENKLSQSDFVDLELEDEDDPYDNDWYNPSRNY